MSHRSFQLLKSCLLFEFAQNFPFESAPTAVVKEVANQVNTGEIGPVKQSRFYDMTSKLDGKTLLTEREPRHQCLIYEGSPSRQLPAMAAMIKRKLNEGYRTLYLNSRPMVAGIQSSLASLGIDVVNEVAKGSLVLSSEPVTSADGGFDEETMLRKLEDALDQALADGYKGLWATGDMTWEFGSEKNLEKLMDYEHGLEAIFSRRPELCGICQYHQDTLPREATRNALLTHRMIFVNQTLSRLNPHYVPAMLSNRLMASNTALDAVITELIQTQDTELCKSEGSCRNNSRAELG